MSGKVVSHYKIVVKPGEGGMGVVYKAEDTRLKRIVALKFLPSSHLANEDDRRRFVHEAQTSASLSHPNIATVFEIDECEETRSLAGESRVNSGVCDAYQRGSLLLKKNSPESAKKAKEPIYV